MTDIFKDWPLKYATAKMAKIRKMYIFQNLVLDQKYIWQAISRKRLVKFWLNFTDAKIDKV